MKHLVADDRRRRVALYSRQGVADDVSDSPTEYMSAPRPPRVEEMTPARSPCGRTGGLLFSSTRAPRLRSVGHGAEAEAGDFQTGLTEMTHCMHAMISIRDRGPT